MGSPVIVIRVDRNGLVFVAALVLVGAASGLLWSESLTLSTTYPSPSGIYNQLVTTGNSGAVAADTTLNRNAGNTILVPGGNSGGRVGIGTASPQAKLDVNGAIKLGGASSGSAGTMRWNGSALQIHDGSGWRDLGGTLGSKWQSGTFYEDTEGRYVGASCPSGQVMTGIYTRNYGNGGHNFWYIECRRLN
jgi:hypothetical protein